MDKAESLRHVPVVIKPAGPKIQSDIFLVATIECPQMGVPQAHLLFAPRENEVMLVAPCGCRVGVRLTELIVKLSHATADPADHPHGAGGLH